MNIHYIDFLSGIQNNLNAEIIRTAESKRRLTFVLMRYRLSQTVKEEITAEIASITKTEAVLRRQYAEIETYKHEYWKNKKAKQKELSDKLEKGFNAIRIPFDGRTFAVEVNDATREMIVAHYKAKEAIEDLVRFVQPQTLPMTVKMEVVEDVLKLTKLQEQFEFAEKNTE